MFSYKMRNNQIHLTHPTGDFAVECQKVLSSMLLAFETSVFLTQSAEALLCGTALSYFMYKYILDKIETICPAHEQLTPNLFYSLFIGAGTSFIFFHDNMATANIIITSTTLSILTCVSNLENMLYRDSTTGSGIESNYIC